MEQNCYIDQMEVWANPTIIEEENFMEYPNDTSMEKYVVSFIIIKELKLSLH